MKTANELIEQCHGVARKQFEGDDDGRRDHVISPLETKVRELLHTSETEQQFSDDEQRLMRFYGVSDLGEVVRIQANQIERLQAQVRQFPTGCAGRAAALGVEGDDAQRLEWLMHQIGGAELRRLGIITSAGCARDDIDRARNAGVGASAADQSKGQL